MKAATLRGWSTVHTWTSLICTVFLLAICVTGLPLIFSSEIDRLSDGGPPYPPASPTSALADADEIVARALHAFPQETVHSIYWPDDQAAAIVTLAATDNANNALDHTITFDAHTGKERERDPLHHHVRFMEVVSHIHEDLFIDLPGELFLGFMALLFVAAIVSGVVLYAPFMRHVELGKRRATRGGRVAWLDLHNVLSAVALLWMTVLGLTGVINELATPLFTHWLETDVRQVFPPNPDRSLPTRLASVTAAIHTVEFRMPGRKIETVDFPTNNFGSPTHYILWTKGETPLTSRIYIPVFVDAVTGKFAAAAAPPWYLVALEISRPLHFGDYGGLPLKILWAVFDLITIVVLVSGLKLWLSGRRIATLRGSKLRHHMMKSGQ